MLEKFLAREMDLEKMLVVSRQINEELNLSLISFKREAINIEEEATNASERLFEQRMQLRS